MSQTNPNKPIVEFYIGKAVNVAVGQSAFVKVKKHYSPDIQGNEVITSAIVTLNPDGSFETMNTLYVPISE